ncbi:MAG: hypothetical protein ACR2PH_04535 [Desulfobulbia bacterium]
MSESDYFFQAEFLLARGYVSGMTIDELADKLLKDANREKPVPEGIHTRENVYGDDPALQKHVEEARNAAHDTQKRLITSGERESAAIKPYKSPLDEYK